MTFFRWLRAFLGGYFWLPCPICGENFGGFETAEDGIMDSWNEGRGVCKNCGEKAREQNKKFMGENPAPVVWVSECCSAPIIIDNGQAYCTCGRLLKEEDFCEEAREDLFGG